MWLLAEPPRARSGTPWVIKFGKLSIWENLVMTSRYVRPYVPTDFPGRGKVNRSLPLSTREFLSPIVSKAFRNDWQIRICQLTECLVDFDFWGGYGWFQKKCPPDWFRQEKSMQINSWKKISLITYKAEKNLTPLYIVEKFLTPERFAKKFFQYKLNQKITHTHSPTNVQWSCQPFRGWEKKRILHLCKCHPSTKWLARFHDVVVFKTKVLHFKIENTPIKDTWKEKAQKNAKFSFCGQTKAFRYKIVSPGIQPCFLHGGSECLACFEPTKAARFLKTLNVHSVLLWLKESTFLKRSFCIYKGFMDVFYILTSVWKKNHKMCIWNWFFYLVLDRSWDF